MRAIKTFAVLALLLLAAPGGAAELVLQLGHRSGVSSVAFSPDATRIASGSWDKTVKVWAVETGQELLSLSGPTEGVNCLAYSPDGKRLVSGNEDKTVRVWDADRGRELLSLKGHTRSVHGVAYSPDGNRIVSVSGNNRAYTLKVWDASKGEEVFSRDLQHWTFGVAYNPDGSRLVSGGGEFGKFGEVKVWDAARGRELLSLNRPGGILFRVAYSPDGKRIVGGCADGTLQIWDGDNGQELLTLKGHTRAVRGVAYSPDGNRIVSGSSDTTVKVWDADSGRELLSLKGHTNEVIAVAFSPDGKRIASGGDDRTVRLWDPRTGQELRALQQHTREIASVACGPDGRRIVGCSTDRSPTDTPADPEAPGELTVWDTEKGEQTFALGGHANWLTSVACRPDGKRLATASADRTVKVWDATTGQELLTFKGHQGWVDTIAFSPDGHWGVSGGGGSGSGELRVWDANNGRERFAIKGQPGAISGAAFSPDGKRIVSASWGDQRKFNQPGELKVWDADRGRQLLSLEGHTRAVLCVAFNRDGTHVVSGSWDRTLKVWDLENGQELLTLEGHTGPVHTVAFSPDGSRIVSGSADKTVKIWDAAKGQELLTLKGHTDEVRGVACTPDGKRIVSGGADGTIRLWDVVTGHELCALLSLDHGKDWLVVTPEGLFDGSQGGREKVHFRVGKGLTVLPVDRFLADYWQPGLLVKIMAGERPLPRRDFPAAAPPTLHFLSPSGPVKTDQEYLTVEVEATDEGGGIDGPFLHHQDTRLRQHQGEEKLGNSVRRAFRVRLVEGPNRLTVKAASQDRVESNPVSLTVVYDKPLVKPDLWVVAAGVSKYAQKDAELQFAAADADALLKLFTEHGKPLYAAVHGTLLLDGDATAEGLRKALKAARDAHPRDTFVLFLSGHGASVEGRYYFLPQEFRTEPGRNQEDDVRQQGVPADELMVLLSQIPALKKVLILDTCNAGAAIRILEKLRGKDDPSRLKREVERLYRSEGLFTIAAAADREEAKEPRELGHGVLTYTLLAAFAAVDKGPLKGEGLRPAGGDVVDVDEWFKYASKRMPDVMRVYFNRDQQPVISTERSGGFPILPVRQR
jgi:WD40 repeat protein